MALVRLGRAGEVWPRLRHSADPRLRSFIVNWLEPLGADPKTIAAALERHGHPAPRNRRDTKARYAPCHIASMDAILFHPETSTGGR